MNNTGENIHISNPFQNVCHCYTSQDIKLFGKCVEFGKSLISQTQQYWKRDETVLIFKSQFANWEAQNLVMSYNFHFACLIIGFRKIQVDFISRKLKAKPLMYLNCNWVTAIKRPLRIKQRLYKPWHRNSDRITPISLDSWSDCMTWVRLLAST